MQPTIRPRIQQLLLSGMPLVAGLGLQACDAGPTDPLSQGNSGTSAADAPSTASSADLGHIVPGTTAILVFEEARLDADGVMIVRGSAACRPVGGVDLPLEVLLEVFQEELFGEGFIRGIVCDGNPQNWRSRVAAFDGTFRRGEARASAFILVCDEDASECESDGSSRRITVRRRL